jgi:signal transduction histidine kinase
MKNELLVSEAQLRAAKERAEQSNRMKSAFLANMSHEIRTPLNAIVGFSNILTNMNPSPEKRKICSDNIQNSSNLLLRLINDILDLSKLEAEKMQFTWDNCDIVPLLSRTISTMEQATANGNRYVFRPRREQLILCTDEQRLQQVLINLLSNASKFTKNGTITLDFTADPAQDHITFSVTDTGRGISPEKRDAVFERFEKLDNFAQGTGLGLSICRQITRKWGGMIWVDPNYNDGARFVFTHPVKPPIDTAPEA